MVLGLPTVSVAFIVSVVAVILVLAICTIYLCIRIRRERRLFRELKAAGLANFEEGNPESINPDLALDEQADLLPYDKKYEFPREKIKLGKQLGAGAFGIVIKGIAQGILPYEEETTVAVKMVKQMADNEVCRTILSFLFCLKICVSFTSMKILSIFCEVFLYFHLVHFIKLFAL